MCNRVLVILLPLVCACGEGGNPTEPPRVVVLGSSTAFGIGPSSFAETWVERYRAHLATNSPDAELVNLSVPGLVTYSALPDETATPSGRPPPFEGANITAALAERPTAMIVNFPSNDAAAGIPPQEQFDNYRALESAAGDVPLFVGTSQPRDLDDNGRANLVAVRDFIHSEYGSRAIDFWTTLANPSGRIHQDYDSGDGIHLNSDGHRILFDRVSALAPEVRE